MLNKLVLAVGLFAAAASAQTVVSVVQGDGQLVPSNLGLNSKPIVFQVTTNGAPAPGVNLVITNSFGLAFSPLSSSNLVTDSNGQAVTQFLPGTLTQSQDFLTYFFTASTNFGPSVGFVETAYYVSPTVQQGAAVYRLAPDPSQLSPLVGTAGTPALAFTVQVLATLGAQAGRPIQYVGVHVLLHQNTPPPGTLSQIAYCAEGVGPEHLVFTNSSGVATCSPTFVYPNAALSSNYDDFTFFVTAGNFNTFGPFGYNISPAPLVLSSLGNRTILANQSFSASLTATGGVAPYTFGLAPGSGPLPPGLALSTSGVLSGIPSTPKQYTFTAQVTDRLGAVTTSNATIAVSGGPLLIIVPAAPVVVTGTFFDLTFRLSGGVPPYTMSPTVALPSTVTFTKSDDVGDTYELKGTLSTPGTFNFGVVAIDIVGSASPVASVSISVVAPLTFTSINLPRATVGQAYSASLAAQAKNGQAPYTFTLAPGSSPLPAGLSLSAAGVLSGTPTTAQNNSFSVQVTDRLGSTAIGSVNLAVTGGPLAVLTPASPTLAAGGTLDVLFHVSGGLGPYSINLTGATLPPGVTFLKTTTSGDTYELKGTFPTAGVFNLSLVATDSLGATSSGAPFSITVAAPLVFTAAALQPGTVSQPYAATLQASGGKTPLVFSLTPGSALPAGLSLSAGGVISGTPLFAGQTAFSVSVTDALGQTASAQFTLSISGGTLAISGPSVLPAAVAGSAYSQTLIATGGVPPYAFQFVGAAPAGLSLSAAGVLSGNLALTGTRTFSVGVTDRLGNTASAQLQLPVLAPLPAVATFSNGASFLGGSIAPGEIVSIFGANLGPVTPTGLVVDTSGKVTTSLAGVQVLIDNIAAPLLYVSSTQINLVVPFGVIHANTTITVVYQSQQSVAVPVVVRGTAPGIFTIGGTQAAVVNQDNSVNDPNNPAARGSVIVIYVTGAGQTTPALTDGQVPAAASTSNIAGLTVSIGGQPATVAYAGAAPGLVAGAVQINVTVPANAPTGSAVPISFSVGNDSSQTTATIAVK